jgi:hypothetical protein
MGDRGLLSLKWHRDLKGYEIRDRPREGVPELYRFVAGFPYVDSAEDRDGKVCTSIDGDGLTISVGSPAGPPLYVVGKGGHIEEYWLHLREDDVYLNFANMSHDPASVCGFADRWGQLNPDVYSPNAVVHVTPKASDDRTVKIRAASVSHPSGLAASFSIGMHVSLYYRYSSLIKSTIEKYKTSPETALSQFRSALRGDWPMIQPSFEHTPGQSALSMIYQVPTLSSFIALEMAQALQGGVDIIACANARCGRLERKRKKGPTPKYCSKKCKQQAYNDRKRTSQIEHTPKRIG